MSRWLFPIGIVLLLSVALGAVHFFFTRLLARRPESAREDEQNDASNP